MTRYILECPRCLARFNLRRYAPDERVRCRKCRAVVIIPRAPGDEEKSAEDPLLKLNPRIRMKVQKRHSLKRLSILSGLFLLALLLTMLIVIRRHRAEPARRAAENVPAPTGEITLDTMDEANRMLVTPFGGGFSWDYALKSGGTETRRVVLASRGRDGAPEFDVATVGSREAGLRTYRVRNDGVYIDSESRGGEDFTFDPPFRLLPHPLYTDDTWSYSGARMVEGGAAVAWTMEYAVARMEKVDAAGAERVCFVVEGKGDRGGRAIKETLWYCRGLGLVKRRTEVNGEVEEALLTAYTLDRE